MCNLVNRKNVCIIISPTLPSSDGGYGIAIDSSLYFYRKTFGKVYFISLSERENYQNLSDDNINFTNLRECNLNKSSRFLLSLLFGCPASTVKYYLNRRKVRDTVDTIINKNKNDNISIIVEDVPLFSCINYQYYFEKNINIILRSHNVLYNSFSEIAKQKHPLLRLAWKYELKKIMNFEKEAIKMVDRFWAITKEDCNEYSNLYKMSPYGVLGVYIDNFRYSKVRIGDIKKIITIGTFDMRKSLGMKKFIDTAWPKIYSAFPDAQLHIAGSGSLSFNNPKLNIFCYGKIINDITLLEIGSIFINTQEHGSGLKLKSLTSMAAGKVLISTINGTLGIEGEDEIHYYNIIDSNDFANKIIHLLNNSDKIFEISHNAKEFTSMYYNKLKYNDDCKHLLEGIII